VLLPELVRQSTQEAARLSYSLKGTGCSDYALTGADHGFPLSQNVFLWRRIFPNRRVNRPAKAVFIRGLPHGIPPESQDGTRAFTPQ